METSCDDDTSSSSLGSFKSISTDFFTDDSFGVDGDGDEDDCCCGVPSRFSSRCACFSSCLGTGIINFICFKINSASSSIDSTGDAGGGGRARTAAAVAGIGDDDGDDDFVVVVVMVDTGADG